MKRCFVSLTLATALSSFGPACGSNNDLTCGDGTIERDGMCVPSSDTETAGAEETAGTEESGANPGGKGDDDDDDDTSETSQDSDASATATATATATDGETTAGGGQPYAACPGGSDVECLALDDEQCVDSLGMCTSRCTHDNECADPADGTAVQRCERTGNWSGICVVYCGAAGFTCPTGMTCQATDLCELNEGGTSGGWGSTGGCDNPSVEICVWE